MVELTVRLIGSLAIVVGLLLVTVRIGGRRFKSRTDAPVRVVHRQALSRTSTVTVVEVGSRVLVLGTTEHQISVLAELDHTELESRTSDPVVAPAGPSTPDAPVAPAAVPAAVAVREAPSAPALPVAPLVSVVPDVQDEVDEVDEVDEESYDPAVLIDLDQVPQTRATRELASQLDASFRVQPSGSVLAGSVLSAATWRQAFTVARGRA